MNLCITSLTLLYEVPNSSMETKEDYLFVILLENKSQTVRTDIGHWNIRRKSVWYSEENVIKNGYINFLKTIQTIKWMYNGRNLEADYFVLKMTKTYPGDNTKFWYNSIFCSMTKVT